MQSLATKFVRGRSGLVKGLSWLDVLVITVSAPTGSGILYYSVNMQTKYPGGSVGVAFLLGLLLFLPVCYLVTAMAAGMPRAGTLYVGISRVIGPQVAYIAALLFFVGQSMIAGVLGHLIMAVVGGIVVALGSATANSTLVSAGDALGSTVGKLVGGFCWVLFFWWVTLRGMAVFRKVMRVFFYIPLLATIGTMVLFAVSRPADAAAAFDATWGEGAFENVGATAMSQGWTPGGFSATATIGLLLVVLWAYNGFEMASYASGEVQEVQRSAIKGFFGGWLVLGLLYVVLSFVVFMPLGEFISAYDYLFQNHRVALEHIMPAVSPSVPFYAISIAPNLWVGALLAIAIVLWFANCIPPIFLSTSRLMFALAMDRAVPEKLADVDDATGAPTWATHLTALFALAGVVFQTFDVTVVLGTLTFCTFFIFWLYGYSAMLLPYKRPDIYEQMPLRRTILSVPLLSLAGLFTFTFGWFVMFFTLREISLGVAAALTAIIALGIIVYFLQYRKCAQIGLDLDLVYRDVPPE